ncbi:hypothetical protein Pelo_6015 [Pelomyxa schiedti]|nr:hypothetical protein Pelo_6015 [Pelomyxa schiedti]
MTLGGFACTVCLIPEYSAGKESCPLFAMNWNPPPEMHFLPSLRLLRGFIVVAGEVSLQSQISNTSVLLWKMLNSDPLTCGHSGGVVDVSRMRAARLHSTGIPLLLCVPPLGPFPHSRCKGEDCPFPFLHFRHFVTSWLNISRYYLGGRADLPTQSITKDPAGCQKG